MVATIRILVVIVLADGANIDLGGVRGGPQVVVVIVIVPIIMIVVEVMAVASYNMGCARGVLKLSRLTQK